MGGLATERAHADSDRDRGSQGPLSLPVRLVARLARELARGAGVVAIFDFDGTLAPIAPTPSAARLPPATRRVLRALAAHRRARVVILSGRLLRDLRARVGVGGVVYGGCHGLEILGRGIAYVHPGAHSSIDAVTSARVALQRGVRGVPGALVEDKRLGVSLHYRHVAPSRRGDAFALVARVARDHPGLRLISGKKVLELVPRVRWDKGRAAGWIVARVAPTLPRAARPPLVLFAGDDIPDETAFAALGAGGITVRVGGRRGGAAYRVGSVLGLRALLRQILRHLD